MTLLPVAQHPGDAPRRLGHAVTDHHHAGVLAEATPPPWWSETDVRLDRSVFVFRDPYIFQRRD
jgi:hypothetical protein